MPRKITELEVQKSLSQFPYRLISGVVKNTNSILQFSCEKHGTFSSSLKKIRTGYQCQKCSAEKRASKDISDIKILLEQLNKKFDKNIEYINGYMGRTKQCAFSCRYHGKFMSTFDSLLRKIATAGCPICAKSKRGKPITSIESIVGLIDSEKYEVVSTSYSSYKDKIQILCKEHDHVSSLSLDKIKNGKRCKFCSRKKQGSLRRLSRQDAINKINKTKYAIGDDYIASSKPATFICPEHGSFKAVLNDIYGGHGCPSCGNKKSQPTTDIVNLISKENIYTIREDRETLKSSETGRFLELDVLVPSKKLAIEYCGLYWHIEDRRDKNYHHKKMILCKEKGLQLITIFEDEWLERRPQIETILRAKLGVLPKIYARKTRLVELDKKTASSFLDKHHLQGSCQFVWAVGLEYNGDVVAVATLSRHHRQNRNEAVLSRVCFGEVAVIGGSSKMLSAMIKKAKEIGYSRLISWSDNRWSNGGVYQALGMTPEYLPPDYSYVHKNRRISKQSCQKKHLLKKGAIGNTELEMAKSLGYSRIWDCGKVRWTLPL